MEVKCENYARTTPARTAAGPCPFLVILRATKRNLLYMYIHTYIHNFPINNIQFHPKAIKLTAVGDKHLIPDV